MSIKSKIIEILEQNRDSSISGQELANILSVSRTAIWKNVQSLEKEGYDINASTNKGYQLNKYNDIVSNEGIKIFLSKKYKNLPINIHKTIDSTNTYAKKITIDGAEHGTIIIANEQTSGKGRFGRSFFSPVNTGIYLSILFRPKKNIADTSVITIAAAVAVCKVIQALTNTNPKIKWVNDIFLNDKKICGILTEAVSDFESGIVESVIVGIGINIKTTKEQFPKEIKETAGSLFPNNIYRNQIIAEIINNLFELYNNLSDKELINKYKEYSLILNKELTYFKDSKKYVGKAIDINKNGNLIVEDKNGQIYILESGEVTLHKK